MDDNFEPRTRDELEVLLAELDGYFFDETEQMEVNEQFGTHILSGMFPLLIVNEYYQDVLVGTLVEKGIASICFDVENIDSDLHDMGRLDIAIAEFIETGLITIEQVAAAGVSLGRKLGQLLDLRHIRWTGCFPVIVPFIASILGQCRQIKKLELNLSRNPGIDDEYRALARSFENNLMLEKIQICGINLQSLRIFCPALATLPGSLSVCSLLFDWRSITIASRADAMTIRRVFSLPSLVQLTLSRIHFETTEIAEVACGGLIGSRIQKFEANEWSFPPGAEPVIANAMAGNGLRELGCSFAGENHEVTTMWEELSSRLSHSESLELLNVGGFHKRLDCIALSAVLRDAHLWKVPELILKLEDWNDELEKAVCAYVQTANSSLRTLHLYSGRHGQVLASEALLTAVDSGTRSLEVLHLGYRESYDPAWYDRLQHVLSLNCQRRLLGPLFANMSRMQSVFTQSLLQVEAIEAMDLVVLFEFLHRNEWDLQGHVQRLARERP